MAEEKQETIDYGKVTGMVHSTESFGARNSGYPFYCLLAGMPYALSVLP